MEKKEIIKNIIGILEKKQVIRYLAISAICIVLISMLLIFRGGPTGFAVFGDDSESEFDLGVYNNVEWNGSAIVLAVDNLTGIYTSQIFDAGNDAVWNNLSWVSNVPNINYLYGVDAGGDVYSSIDLSSWTMTKENYGRTTDGAYMFSDSSYIYILSNLNKEVWRSGDLGVSWAVVNNSFADSSLLVGESDSNDNLFVADASGDVYKSSDSGVTWSLIEDFNGVETNSPKGIGINSLDDIYIVDGAGDVYSSTDSAVNWIKVNDGYGGGSGTDDLKTLGSNVYILLNKDIYESSDGGVSWSLINDSFTSYSNNGLRMAEDDVNLYIADDLGSVFKSSDSGISWQEQGDFNAGATNDPIGIAFFSKPTTLDIQVKSCNDNVCSGESWEGPYGTDELPNNKFDETAYNSAGVDMSGNVLLFHLNESSGNPVDDSGAENSIGLIRGVSYGVGGKFNSAMDFNGVDGTIDVNYNDSNFNFSRSGAFTVAGWIKPDGLHQGGDAEIISHYRSATENRVWSLVVRNNVIRFVACSDGTLASCVYATGTTKVEVGTWYYVVGRWDGNNVEVYVNGVSEDPQTDALASLHSTNDTGVRIGRDVSIVGEGWFNGTIDEIAIWNRGLSDSEIINLYYKGINNSFETSPQDLNVNNNQYFQYKVDFSSSDSSISPILTSVDINYDLVNSAPSLTLVSPPDGVSLGYNESIALNFSVFDADDNLDSCWYNLNDGVNVSLASCVNSTFDIAEGSHSLNIYANDSLGLSASDSASFSVTVGAPTIVLSYPIDVYFGSGNNIVFNYTPTDVDLDSCWLLGDFTGDYGVNQTNISVSSGIVNKFFLNLSDGTYLWNIGCNDSIGNSAVNGNKTFYVDSVAPVVSVFEPTGEKISRTISFEWSVFDTSPISCLYNVYQGASLEVANTSVTCGDNSASFEVSSDADFAFNFYVNDSAGNLNNTSSSFSVDTSETPVIPSSSETPSGGGGGSSSALSGWGRMQVSEIGDIIAHEGEQKTLLLNVKNAGVIFLNNCKLVVDGEVSSWIYSTQVEGIAFGQEVDFEFNLNVPEGTELGSYLGELKVDCDEGTNIQNISISIPGLQSINVKDIIQEGDDLKINYVFSNVGNEGEVSIDIWIVDRDGIEIKRITDVFSASGENVIEREVLVELPKSMGGIYSIYFALSSDLESFVKKSAVLGKSRTVGMAILDNAKGKFGVYIVFLLFTGLGVFFIWKRHKDNNQHTQKTKNRWLIRKKGKLAR